MRIHADLDPAPDPNTGFLCVKSNIVNVIFLLYKLHSKGYTIMDSSPCSWYSELPECAAAAGAPHDAVPGAGGGQREGGAGAAGGPAHPRLHRLHRSHRAPHPQHPRQVSHLLIFLMHLSHF